MKKKLIALALVTAMVGSLAACNTSKKAAEATTEETYDDGYIDIDIEASEYVELGEYKNITIEGDKIEVTDEEVKERVEEDRLNFSTYEKIDRDTVKEEDIINVNYVCSVNGEIVDDFNEEDIDMIIGEGQIEFLNDVKVESALVGAKVGETKKFTGTFSEELYSESIAGKEGEMEVTINYIEEEKIPELTDAFVKENLGFNTYKEYEADTRKQLEDEAKSYADENNQYKVFNVAVENAKIIKDFPEDVKAAERSNTILELTEQAYYYGIEIGDTDEELETFFQENYGQSIDEYVEDSLKRICVIDLILEAEKVQVTEEEIDAALQEEYESGGYESQEEFNEVADREETRSQLEYSKLFDILMSTATVK